MSDCAGGNIGHPQRHRERQEGETQRSPANSRGSAADRVPSRKIVPYSVRLITRPTSVAALNVALRKKPSGTIGSAVRASLSRKPAPQSMAPMKPATTTGASMPRCPASMMAPVRLSRVSNASACPGRSSAPFRRDVSATVRYVHQMPAAPIGMFTRKMLRQPSASTSTPPSSGPADKVTLPAAVHRLIARARATPSSPHAWVNRASEHGTTNAAPTPCRARAAMSVPCRVRCHRPPMQLQTP